MRITPSYSRLLSASLIQMVLTEPRQRTGMTRANAEYWIWFMAAMSSAG